MPGLQKQIIIPVLLCLYLDLTPGDCRNWRTIVVKPTWVVPFRVHVLEGTPVKAYCGSFSPPQWIFGNSRVNKKHETHNNSITFHNLENNDSGIYYCHGTLHENMTFRNYFVMFVRTSVGFGEVLPDYLEISQNDSVTVYCGSTNPVEWFGVHFKDISKVEKANKLVLKNLRREHSGRYFCRGVNLAGKIFHSQVIIIVDANVIFNDFS